jgi:hypothetical protein
MYILKFSFYRNKINIVEIHKLAVTFPKCILPIHCTSSFVSLQRVRIVFFKIIWLMLTGVGDCSAYDSSSCADCANLNLIFVCFRSLCKLRKAVFW